MTSSYKKLPIHLNPHRLYLLIQREYPYSFLLESLEGQEKLARFSFIGFGPKEKIVGRGKVVQAGDDELEEPQPLAVVRQRLPRQRIEQPGFVGGAVGYVGYEYARNLEKLPERKKRGPDFPDFEFGIFEDAVVYDHRDRSVGYLSHGDDRSAELVSLSREEQFTGPFEAGAAKADTTQEQFEANVEIAKEHIRNGDVFQVVLSRRYEMGFEGNPLRVYNHLKQTNPSPYMYYLSFGERKVIGSSPENLVRVEGRTIDSYATLAGTMPRGKTAGEDRVLEEKLLSDPKERAEHLMLVDLTRNDVGKVAKAGSVKVPEMMEVHKYRHVQHLSSHVQAQLGDGKDCFDAFNALFPAGTLTGAPKVRSMEIIEELEEGRRGPYGGAVGYFGFNGNCDFAIGIRTLFTHRQKAYLQAGAGIVYDSDPTREFEETENKMKALLNSLETSERVNL